MSRSKGWCFTINNHTEEDHKEITALAGHKHLKYLVCGKEVGEEGTPHIQGYCYLNVEKSRKNMSKMLTRANLRPAKGSAEQNYNYCSKDGDFIETGTRPISQKRKGELGAEYWAEQLSLAKKGRIDECDPKLQITHDLALHRIAARNAPVPIDNKDMEHLWYYGPTGSGKTLKARTDNPGYYDKLLNKWWDDYKGESVVLIDDFDIRHEMLGSFLKRWADHGPFRAEYKGGSKLIRPSKIIVTSNWKPDEIWPKEPQTLDPILRRYKVVKFPQLTINDVL